MTERERGRKTGQPSTEEKVNRIIEAGERARQDPEHQYDEKTTSAAERIERAADQSAAQADRTADRISAAGHQTADKAGQKADETTGRVSATAHQVAGQASHKADDMAAKVSNAAHQAADKAHDVAARLRETDSNEVKATVKAKHGETKDRADSTMTSTGEQMESMAQRLRERAPQGQAGTAAYRAADALDRGGDYLRHSNPDTVRGDLETTIRRHPVESLLVGAGVGFLLGKAFRSGRR